MFTRMKPGHVLSFQICPSTILSPPGPAAGEGNNNTLETPWPNNDSLGLVSLLSHPSVPIGQIAADVAAKLRPGIIKSSSWSYSGLGRRFTSSDIQLGSEICGFVGYTEGKSYYISSSNTVFSKDFSGCLMVAYTVHGDRRVAHVAASQIADMDCKQAFLTTLQEMGANLIGWFKPYASNTEDEEKKINAFTRFGRYINNNISNLVTFGVVTSAGQAYSIDAFKPIPGNKWVVTRVSRKVMSTEWNV